MKNAYIIISILVLFALKLNAQEFKKDTLFFELKKNYLSQGFINKNQLHIKDSNADETFYFEILDTINTILKPKKILNLKDFIRGSKFYNKQKKRKLNDYRLWEFLRDYEIFLIKKDCFFIKVRATLEVE